MSTPKIIVITGPTATGKTALGVALAKELCGEVVSADSMQIYKYMNIGTAKVRPEETCGIPHHMVDILDPAESFSVARYVEMADKCVQDILARGKLPIVVGGTGLYIDSLISGRSFGDGAQDSALRTELEAEYDALGGEEMLKRLYEFDPQRAEKLHPSDKKRILRAFEVYRLTGQTITAHDEKTKLIPPRYSAMTVILSYREREKLYARIDRRVDEMVQAGLFSEVDSLLKSGVPEKSTAIQAIGYKEVVLALKGEISDDEAIDLIKRESRRYAKRQLTWLSRNKTALRIFWEDLPDIVYARQLSTDCFHSLG